MSRIRKNEAGFGVIEIILVVVIVGLIGLVGYMFYKNQQDNTPAASNESPTTQTSTPTNSAAPTPASTTKPAVVISEWGIKVEFDDADKVTYKLATDASGTQSVGLYLKDSVASVCQDLGVGFNRETTKGEGDNSTKVGDYYYQLRGGPGRCSDDPGGDNGSINQLRSKIIGTELNGHYTVSAAQ